MGAWFPDARKVEADGALRRVGWVGVALAAAVLCVACPAKDGHQRPAASVDGGVAAARPAPATEADASLPAPARPAGPRVEVDASPPPSGLVRFLVRSPDRVRVEVATSDSGRDLWFRETVDGDQATDWQHARARVEDPASRGRLVVTPDAWGGGPAPVWVSSPGEPAIVWETGVGPEPLPLEHAPGRGHRVDPREALADTRMLRCMETCPVSHRPCLLYGDETDVWAARDPLRPPTGWGLVDRSPVVALNAQPTADAHPVDEWHGVGEAREAMLRVYEAPPLAPGRPAGAAAILFWRDRRTFAFELTSAADAVSATVARADRVLVAWAVNLAECSLDARAFDATTAEPMGPPWHVAAHAHDPEASSGCRITPWWADRLGAAILEDAHARSAVVFDAAAGPGRRISIVRRAPPDDEVGRTGAPLLVLRAGRLVPVR